MSNSSGIWFSGALFLIFLVLKLTNLISWSWWWVTAPLWIPFAFVGTILLLGFVGTILLSGIVVAVLK